MALNLRIGSKLAVSAGLGIVVLLGIVATQEIARNVNEAAKGTGQVATGITDVDRGAGKTGTASSRVLSSAQSLSSKSSHLRSEVEKFLSTVRAA